MLPQLPLKLVFPDQPSFTQYYAGTNLETVTALKRCASGKGEPLLYLWGESGTGKSHLLQASCREAYALGKRAAYLPLAELTIHSPALLEGLEQVELICADDIGAIAGKHDWEQGFFHCFNRLQESGTHLIIAGRLPPVHTLIQLPDLKTRLGWGLVLRLKPLTDSEKLTALCLRARYLGLELSPQIGRFLLTHYRRDLPSLWQLLEQLDQATLAAKRKLTIPFLKQYLKERACES